MSPETRELPPNQIRAIYDNIRTVQNKYEQRLITLQSHDGVFDNECESDKHHIELKILDDICMRLDELSDDFFRGM